MWDRRTATRTQSLCAMREKARDDRLRSAGPVAADCGARSTTMLRAACPRPTNASTTGAVGSSRDARSRRTRGRGLHRRAGQGTVRSICDLVDPGLAEPLGSEPSKTAPPHPSPPASTARSTQTAKAAPACLNGRPKQQRSNSSTRVKLLAFASRCLSPRRTRAPLYAIRINWDRLARVNPAEARIAGSILVAPARIGICWCWMCL